ncbi:MAG: aspartate/glutamate racemase family protein, partial [Acetobacteraceae bacterium]
TLDMELYQQRLGSQGWNCLTPTPVEMERYVSPAIALVKANRVVEAFMPALEVVRSLTERGAKAVVLGCTELPLAVRAGTGESLEIPVINTIDALARAAIAWARSS